MRILGADNLRRRDDSFRTDRTLYVVFSRLSASSFKITLTKKNPKELYQTFSLSFNSTRNAIYSFGILPQVYYERKPLNLKKTTSNVLSVLLLIYAFGEISRSTVYRLHVYCTSTTCSIFFKV